MPVITKIQQRRGTSTQWSTTNPVLAVGEIGVDTTLANIKIGNGTSTWNSLPFLPLSDSARLEMWDKSEQQVLDKAPPSNPLGNRPTKVGMIIGIGGGTYDNLKVESLTTIIDPESGRIAGVYTGYGNATGVERGSICLAYSDDGINWEKKGVTLGYSNVAGSGDQNGCTGPVLVHDNGLYYLFYIGLTGTGYEGGEKALMLATSPSLKTPNWTRRGIIMAAGGTGWRADHIWHPSVVRHRGKWYCFMNASGADGKERIGYATADQLTGPWTFDDVNSPLLTLTGTENIIGDPCVTKIDGGWRMDYFTAPSGQAMDWYTTTSDAEFPLGWEAHDSLNTAKQTIAPGPSGSFDAVYAHKPFIMHYAGRTYHYYTAVSTAGDRTIALAIDGPVPFKGDVLTYNTPVSIAKFCSVRSNFADVVTGSSYAESALARCKVQAREGDTIEITAHLVANNGSGDLRVDACPIVNNARSTYVSGLGASGNGVSAWGAIGGRYEHAGGTYHYRLSASDIEKGVATIALVFKNSGSGRNIFASTDPINFAVHNLGQ